MIHITDPCEIDGCMHVCMYACMHVCMCANELVCPSFCHGDCIGTRRNPQGELSETVAFLVSTGTRYITCSHDIHLFFRHPWRATQGPVERR